ncbi:hypothetical protein GCM10019016_083340 [Streptomyces prasinosporus]|uniref:ABC transporter domain-containing protein n=1 Tax=Streptomyces prasinosporus TaxID=68256 RepID=A0ABP6U1D3_9ACTN
MGRQIAEPFMKHTGASKREARERAIEMLTKVGIPQPRTRVDDYPHQFSGGMRQRAMIAMALVCDPDLLIADEPTTALDVTVQAQILDLLKDLQQEFGSAIIFITHDLGVISDMADDLLVMYSGRAVERGSVREVLREPPSTPTPGACSARCRASAATPRRRSTRSPDRPPSLLNPPSGCPFHPALRLHGQGVGQPLQHGAPAARRGRAAACHLTAEQKQTIFIDTIQPRLR